MKIKNICNYITLLVLGLSITFSIAAVKIDSYLVTDGFEMTVPSGTKTYYYKNIPVNYQSGKVMLSLNADGTGEAFVGESIDISVLNGDTFEYKTKATSCQGSIKMQPLDITHLMRKGLNNVQVRYRKVWCSQQKVDKLYLVHFNDYEPTTTPFLDLPWDYTNKGLSFVDAATSMFSYFDHEYPLLSAEWFLTEPSEVNTDVINFMGQKSSKPYSRHDGYDYAFDSKAFLNDPVLAAASGIATFHNDCNACGNAVHINHENGYQTRYYHLQPDGLITNNPNLKINVSNRQQIGKIGLTGNTNGAHIHFMLIQDKNGDGNFEDNIPDGIVDPYGWQGSSLDPWTQFTFTQNGQAKTGTKSTYLWKNSLNTITKTLTPNGGSYTSDRFTFTFPKDSTKADLIFKLKPILFTEPAETLQPLGYVIDATANDGFGNFITQFNKLFTISMKLLVTDISRFKPESLSIYSSSDGTNWLKENTIINFQNNTATTQVNHLTQFAFMGEKLDTIAPITEVLINNEAIGITTFYEPITILLQSTDAPSEHSLGIDYAMYKVNNNEWQLYTEPFLLSDTGPYSISFYSIDKDGNSEEIKNVHFVITEFIPIPTIEDDKKKLSYNDNRIKKINKKNKIIKKNISESFKKFIARVNKIHKLNTN